MFHFKFTDGQRDQLIESLKALGVPVPDKVEFLSSGANALCFIGEDHVLKLFRRPNWWSKHIVKHRAYVEKAICVLDNLKAAKVELAKRGVDMPSHSSAASFVQPVEANGQTFVAWQAMSRVPGQRFPASRHWFSRKTPRTFALTPYFQMARIAGKLHMPAPANAIVEPLSKLENWIRLSHPDVLHKQLAAQLKQDGTRFMAGPAPTVLAHGDLWPCNAVWNKNGRVGVVDWDQSVYSRPEYDLLWSGSLPRHAKTFTAAYQATSGRTVNRKLLTLYGFAWALGMYKGSLEERGFHYGSSKTWLEDCANALNQVAQEASRVTGKPIYAEYAALLTAPQLRSGKWANLHRTNGFKSLKPHL